MLPHGHFDSLRSKDPYFPHGVVDLRYAISCEPVNEKDIRLRTNQKSIRLSADSVPSRDEWVKAIRKVMVKATNMGDSIKVRNLIGLCVMDDTNSAVLQIAIPYPAVVDVERSKSCIVCLNGIALGKYCQKMRREYNHAQRESCWMD